MEESGEIFYLFFKWGIFVLHFFYALATQNGLQDINAPSESELTQSCPTLCDPMDCGLPGSSVHGILQARVGWLVAKLSPIL